MEIEKRCINCNKIFRSLQSSCRKFCTHKCFGLYRSKFWSPSLIHRQAISKKTKGSKLPPRKESHCKHISEAHKCKPTWNKGLKNSQVAWNKGLVMKNYYDEEQYKKFMDMCIMWGIKTQLRLSSNKTHRTSIEKKISSILIEIGCKYFEQYPIMGITVADFYLPDEQMIIYADGDYWHNYPYGTKKDHEVEKELTNNHYRVLRFWEKDINSNIQLIKEKIIRELQRL